MAPDLIISETKRTGRLHPRWRFSPAEDSRLKELVELLGEGDWQAISDLMPGRNLRQCKDRWENYLTPKRNTDPWTDEEERLLEEKVKELGYKWTVIARFFHMRTDINVKNHWMVIKRRKIRIAESEERKRMLAAEKALGIDAPEQKESLTQQSLFNIPETDNLWDFGATDHATDFTEFDMLKLW